jgi:ketosteroid isomerase-like protein
VDEHPNATASRETADAFRAADMESLRRLIDADVVWHVPGRNRLSGEVVGRAAFFEWFQRLRDVTGGSFHLEEHDVVANDDHVVALSRMSADRETPVSVDVVSAFHYRDGRQLERWLLPGRSRRLGSHVLRKHPPSRCGLP